MGRLGIAQTMASMLSGIWLGSGNGNGNGTKSNKQYQFSQHATKKVPCRSKGMKQKQNKSGSKLAKKAFNGMCGIRGNVGAAGRLALEGKLCK